MTDPYNVTRIESNAFKSCSSLREVTIGNGLAGMGDGAFANCKELARFEVASGNTAFCAEDGVLFSKDKSTLVQYPAGKAETTYAIPDGVTRLGTEAFYGCSSLLTLHCGTATPPALGSNCFKSSGITTVFIPAGTLNKSADVYIEVTEVLTESALMSVIDAIKQGEHHRSTFKSVLDTFSAWLLPILLVAAGGTYAVLLHAYGAGNWFAYLGVLLFVLAAACPVAWVFVAVFPFFFTRTGARRVKIKIQNIYTYYWT